MTTGPLPALPSGSPPEDQPPTLRPADDAAHSPELASISCNACQTLNSPAALTCSACGVLLAADDATRRFGAISLPSEPNTRFGGNGIAGQRAITLDIQEAHITLPDTDVVTLGRVKAGGDVDPPDVDLSPYQAKQQGVSRKHIRIQRKDVLYFVTDLGSTNGTSLNGQRLLAHTERMLRSGDELTLGQLKMRVHF